MKLFRCLALFSATLMMIPAFAHADDLVVNGSFSDGTTGWNNNNGEWFVGDSYASTGCVGSDCITGSFYDQADLDQYLATTSGSTYTLTFDYNPGGGSPTELEVLFGGNIVSDLVNIDGYDSSTYTVTGLVANSSNTELEFLGRQDPGYDALTNISVVTSAVGAPTVTPEPESLVLLGTGVLGIAGVARRRLFGA